MDSSRRLHIRSWVAVGLGVVLMVGGCSPSDDAATTVTVTVTTKVPAEVTLPSGSGSSSGAEVGSGGPIVVAPPVGSGDPTGTEAGADGRVDTEADAAAEKSESAAARSSAAAQKKAQQAKAEQAAAKAEKRAAELARKKALASKKAAKAAREARPAEVTITPAKGTRNVEPLQRISVTTNGGHLSTVRVVNPERKTVYHQYRINAKSWSVDPELGYGRRYRVIVDSVNRYGHKQQDQVTFTTKQAKTLISAHVFPSDGMRVGVGQPVRVTFSAPIKGSSNKLRVQDMITVNTSDHRSGRFRWYSDTEVRWRPEHYFMSRSNVGVKVKIYGEKLGHGAYGAADVTSRYHVARKMISYVDAKTHRMVVKKDNRTIKEFPVSLGNAKYPTYNGVHIVTEKHKTYVMDSSTWGLEGAGAYRTKVKWATRISNSGEFVHGAPWSVSAQGNTNVSHGCINLTDAGAHWYQRHSLPGDVLTVRNSTGPRLKSYDGYGDWNLPYTHY